ncbi:MAG: Nif3-like dinuclear metal center hexameric protein [Saccharospirillum sp.]|nr:Nif3-like dinuclear metal center hexameric protein [Saccharospirillum sp.]
MLHRDELADYLQEFLEVDRFNDYCPNGLQVAGKPDIRRIVTGVTASQRLIDEAIERQADAILVHHGYFWKGEPAPLTGIKRDRIAALLRHDLNLFAYHLPLDAHPQVGNNMQLAHLMGWEVQGELAGTVGLRGALASLETGASLKQALSQALEFDVLHIGEEEDEIESIAWCTGAAQGYLQQAIEAGVDAFVSGEISEPTVHLARESGVHYYAAGHHATERGGPQALGRHLGQRFGIAVEFIDLPIPV